LIPSQTKTSRYTNGSSETRDLVVIENLCNLDEIDVGLVTICALPLKFRHSDGAPARVIAILDR
jgi:kynurenine formamidase